MDVIREMFSITFAQFLVGSVGLLSLIPFRILGRNFFKTCAWIFVVLVLVHWWIAPRPSEYTGVFSLFGSSLWVTWKGREFGSMIVFAFLTIFYLLSLYRLERRSDKRNVGCGHCSGDFLDSKWFNCGSYGRDVFFSSGSPTF